MVCKYLIRDFCQLYVLLKLQLNMMGLELFVLGTGPNLWNLFLGVCI
jgi:hypothetical protein